MINAYLTRKVSRYLESLGRGLLDHGFQATPVVMQSSGGVLALEHAKSLPVRLLTSGPAGGVIGAQVFVHPGWFVSNGLRRCCCCSAFCCLWD